jgi:hypothetical protein
LKSRIFSIIWLVDGREGSGARYRSGSVQIIADPDPGGPKLSNHIKNYVLSIADDQDL